MRDDYKDRIIAKLDKIKGGRAHVETKFCSSCGNKMRVAFDSDQDITRGFCPACESNNNYKRSDV